MLLYHPYYDSRHCIFRMLCILEELGEETIEWQRLQILDYFLLFPESLGRIRLPRDAQRIKKIVRRADNPYDRIPDSRVAFSRLMPIQETSLANLGAHGLVKIGGESNRKISRTASELPERLSALITKRREQKEELFKFLVSNLGEMDLYGANGLRARANLFDFRYDL